MREGGSRDCRGHAQVQPLRREGGGRMGEAGASRKARQVLSHCEHGEVREEVEVEPRSQMLVAVHLGVPLAEHLQVNHAQL